MNDQRQALVQQMMQSRMPSQGAGMGGAMPPMPGGQMTEAEQALIMQAAQQGAGQGLMPGGMQAGSAPGMPTGQMTDAEQALMMQAAGEGAALGGGVPMQAPGQGGMPQPQPRELTDEEIIQLMSPHSAGPQRVGPQADAQGAASAVTDHLKDYFQQPHVSQWLAS